ncbi:MAG: patatin [Azospira oryzae]|jgi:NTE family protein|nr:MAG: patatin [Azospira oryzae]
MIRPALLVGILSVSMAVFGQRVGVVLSGGGAKGFAHIGVLKALEENEIPIDYVVGTSMGGVVAGCYAAGMSPQQIEDMILSSDFKDWINGRLEKGYNYYYNKTDEHPSFIKLSLSLDSTLSLNLNTSIAKDLSLNFAFAERLAQPSAIAKNNFDSLFVPLRIVAADIFTQSQVILKKGVLSDAVRATTTVPLFYNPVKVDGKYLFDGGVYNNFPVDIVHNEFHPDVIIGCNVSSKVFKEYPYDTDDKLISRSLLYLLLDKSDPELIPETGVYLHPNLSSYTSFDFAKAKNMIDSGYIATLRQISEIKAKIGVRRTCESVAAKRNVFNSKTQPLIVEHIRFRGFNSRQQRYINRFFKNGERPLYFTDIKTGYYELVSDDYFKNIYPNFIYDTETRTFDFQLSKRPQNNFQVDFGGVVTTRSVSEVFLGLNYYRFNRSLLHTNINVEAGGFYKSLQAKVRLDVPRFNRFYIEPEATFNNWDFFTGRDVLIKGFTPNVLNRIDRKVGASIGIPLGRQFKASLNVSYINNFDRFLDSDVITSQDTLDQLKLSGYRTGINIVTNQLNRKQYASQGKAYQFSLDWFSAHEEFTPGNTSIMEESEKQHRWVRAKLTMEEYFKTGFYSSGYLFEGVLSNQSFLSNYQGSIINAPGFYPLQDSRTILLQNFRAYNYIAGGWRNVFAIRKNLEARLEAYVFKPFQAISKGPNQEAFHDSAITKMYFAGTAGLVLHSTVGPISLNVNYYDDSENQLGVMLHVGFLLFHRTSLE